MKAASKIPSSRLRPKRQRLGNEVDHECDELRRAAASSPQQCPERRETDTAGAEHDRQREPIEHLHPLRQQGECDGGEKNPAPEADDAMDDLVLELAVRDPLIPGRETPGQRCETCSPGYGQDDG